MVSPPPGVSIPSSGQLPLGSGSNPPGQVTPRFKGTIQSGLRLVPSGNFFLALKRSHHFLLEIWQVKHNDSNLITLLNILSIFQQCKIIKIESFCSSCLLNSDFFKQKIDVFYLKQKINFLMAQA